MSGVVKRKLETAWSFNAGWIALVGDLVRAEKVNRWFVKRRSGAADRVGDMTGLGTNKRIQNFFKITG